MTPGERYRRIDSLLDKALELDAPERATFLDEACAGDAALRGEIDALLDAHQDAGSFMSRPAIEEAAQALAAEPSTGLVGRRLGPYPVLSLVGAGGMGEVYRAHDPRLGRDVAIKVLPRHLTTSPDALARFEREVKAVAALSHPNILAIHDVGTDQGVAYAVMELLDGATLRDRLGGSPMAWHRATATAVQIADGLAAAHAKGIVHRDLKPENIFMCASGQVKILDFGLVRVVSPAAPIAPAAPGATSPDTVMGTPGYMSPEQVRGEDTGPSSDIFSFGCVLYEMLSGRAPFTRDTPIETLAAVLRDEPAPLSGEGSDVPFSLETMVLHCLEKRPQDRFQSASDMVFALRALSTEPLMSRVPGSMVAARPSESPSRRWRLAVGTALGLAAGAIIGGLAASRLAAPPPVLPAVVRLSFPLGDGPLAPNDSPSAGSSVAISRDGRWIAYATLVGGRRRLVLRALEAATENVVPGTDGALTPVFSPDGRWIAFFTESELRKVPRSGGAPTTLCQVPPVTRGAVWGDEDMIYFTRTFTGGVQRVPAGGGVPTDVTSVDLQTGESNHLLPEILPGGNALLFTVWHGGDFGAATIWSQSLRTGGRKRLLDAAAAPRYLAPGYLVFARNGALFVSRFDAERLEVIGEAVPVIDGVWTDRATGTAHYAVAQNGTLVYAPGSSTVERRRLVWVDRRGRMEPLPADPSFYGALRLSPDGRRIAVEALNDLWVYHLDDGTLTRATFRGVNQHPAWSPDGRYLAFSSSQGVTSPTLFRTDADTGSLLEPLTGGSGRVQFPGSWTPDGRTLAYAELAFPPATPDTGWDIHLLRPGRTPDTEGLVQTPFKDDQPMFSPDGRTLAYVSDETGALQVYLRSFPDTGPRARVSTDGGTEPVWSRRGDELFYRHGRRYFSVPVTTSGDALRPGRPSFMFEGDFVVVSVIPGFPSYDVAPDGRRFIMVTRADDTPRPVRLEVALGWAEDLERRLRTPPAR